MLYVHIGKSKIGVHEFIEKMKSNHFLEENDIWVYDENYKYPCLSLLVNNEYVVLHFFKNADDTGCISVNENKNNESKHIVFGDICLDSTYAVDRQIAIDCITEFVTLKKKPDKIKWNEL